MKEPIGGNVREQPSLLDRTASGAALRRVFESEEIGLFHFALGSRPVRIGHEQLVSLILCLEGRAVLSDEGDDRVLEGGNYAVVREGETCELAAHGAAAEVLLFVGFEQLPGAFFNSYGPANV